MRVYVFTGSDEAERLNRVVARLSADTHVLADEGHAIHGHAIGSVPPSPFSGFAQIIERLETLKPDAVIVVSDGNSVRENRMMERECLRRGVAFMRVGHVG